MKESRDILNAAFLNLPGKPFFAAKKTDPDRLRKLMKALTPVQTVKPLIRLGPPGDGGYLVPDDLAGISTCFSPGVSTVSDLELECAQRGMDVFMADASVAGPATEHPRFRFLPKFLGAYTRDEFITMEDWIESAAPDSEGDWIFQIDIESAEYEVILSMPERYLRKARIIVIEFHRLDYLFDSNFFDLAEVVFGKILRSHTCVHIHPNNSNGIVRAGDIVVPKILELTFYRNDGEFTGSKVDSLPHTLDAHSVPEFPPISLPDCWYR